MQRLRLGFEQSDHATGRGGEAGIKARFARTVTRGGGERRFQEQGWGCVRPFLPITTDYRNYLHHTYIACDQAKGGRGGRPR